MSELLTYSEAAVYLNTTERHVRALWNRRQLKATKVGRLVRFHRDDLDQFIAKSREVASA